MSLSFGLGIGKGEGSQWTPRQLGLALKLWLEPNYGLLNESDPAVFPGVGDQLTKWTDLSRHGNHATATGSGFSYSTGNGGYVHAAGTEKMSIPQISAVAGVKHSIWARVLFKDGLAMNSSDIFYNDADSEGTDFWRTQSATSQPSTLRGRYDNNTATFTLDAGTPGTDEGQLQDNTWYTIGLERDESNVNTAYINDVATATVPKNGTLSFDQIVGGNGMVLGGYVVLIGKLLTSDERTKLHNYFTRWETHKP